MGEHWFLAPASFTHIFETSPDKVWQRTLRDLGGKYPPFSLIPDDLKLELTCTLLHGLIRMLRNAKPRSSYLLV